jgi:calcineurin-like phosphoesterase family protein
VSVDQMDNIIINNINSKIQQDDILYHLGDFSLAKNLVSYRERIVCQNIHLILGNHDKLKTEEKKHFKSIHNLSEIKYQNNLIVLCHYAMRVWNKSHHGSFHLYGHSHGVLPSQGKSMDVGVDSNNFFPISINEVIKRLSK